VLPEGHDYKTAEAKLPPGSREDMGLQLLQATGMNLAQFLANGNSRSESVAATAHCIHCACT